MATRELRGGDGMAEKLAGALAFVAARMPASSAGKWMGLKPDLARRQKRTSPVLPARRQTAR